MKKSLKIIGLLAVLASTTAFMKPPPEQFDYEPTIKVELVEVSGTALRHACRSYKRRLILGCAYLNKKVCVVFLQQGLSGDIRKSMLRHEYAHCNGWSNDHRR